ncbi:P-loop containing nucleoside triphosphate hydrolase protein [Lasiosphaeria ovina]|uniref:P-loop containing nucleoside triphosphate hydrolase protein n=1 Tax=Lasiosphaeria ovina TaxID=92902 RepID=A0AAE0KBQ3_9PEZI|nr:P-loop containing nucleoside triphosphate hydrolase protein [Lasiosphaeria ovina]
MSIGGRPSKRTYNQDHDHDFPDGYSPKRMRASPDRSYSEPLTPSLSSSQPPSAGQAPPSLASGTDICFPHADDNNGAAVGSLSDLDPDSFMGGLTLMDPLIMDWVPTYALDRTNGASRGTPIQNHFGDLVSLLRFLHFEPFAQSSVFQRHILEPLSKDTSDRAFRLKALLSTVCLRRSEKLLQLPDSRVEHVPVTLRPEERLMYDGILDKCARDLDDVASSRAVVDRVERAEYGLKRVGYSDRLRVLEQFTSSEAPVLLMSIQTGAVGLNLTAANYVHIVEPQWNPSVEEQAIARAVRMGQMRSVTIVRCTVKSSVEENIVSLQRKKRNLARFTLDSAADGSPDSLDNLKFVLDFK